MRGTRWLRSFNQDILPPKMLVERWFTLSDPVIFSNHSNFTSTGLLSINQSLIKADKSARVNIASLDCVHLDIRAINSTVDIENGRVQNLSNNEPSKERAESSSDKQELLRTQTK
jgi:hypothetical protein